MSMTSNAIEREQVLRAIRHASPGLRGKDLAKRCKGDPRFHQALCDLDRTGKIRFVPGCGWIEKDDREARQHAIRQKRAQAYADRVTEVDHPCVYGHFGCADREGGRCSDEVLTEAGL